MHGAAVWQHPDGAAWLGYHITADANWNVHRARVRGVVAARPLDLTVRRSASGLWGMNGYALAGSQQATDLDLGFTPAALLFTLRQLSRQTAADETPLTTLQLDIDGPRLDLVGRRLLRPADRRWQLIGADGSPRDVVLDQWGILADYGPWLRQPAG